MNRNRTFAQTAARTFGVNLVVGSIAALGFFAMPDAIGDREPVTPFADAIFAEHDCWTGAAPADVEYPGHVIVAKPNEGPIYSKRLVGPALDQQFAGVDNDLHVYGFCR